MTIAPGNSSPAPGGSRAGCDAATFALRIAATIPLDLARAAMLLRDAIGSASLGADEFGGAVLTRLNDHALQRLIATPRGSEVLDLLRVANLTRAARGVEH